MLGQAGSGKLRVSIGQSKLSSKVAKRLALSFCFYILFIFLSCVHFISQFFLFFISVPFSFPQNLKIKFILFHQSHNGQAFKIYLVLLVFRFKEKSFGSSGATSGLTSSLAFTPVQVIISSLEILEINRVEGIFLDELPKLDT